MIPAAGDQARRQQRYRRVRPWLPRAPPGREHPPRQARWPLPGSSLAPPTLKHGLADWILAVGVGDGAGPWGSRDRATGVCPTGVAIAKAAWCPRQPRRWKKAHERYRGWPPSTFEAAFADVAW